MNGRAFLAMSLTFLLAGCTGTDRGPIAPPEPEDPAKALLLERLATFAPPAYDELRGVNWWADFVNGQSLRQFPLPTNNAASEFLKQELKDAGFEAHTLDFPVGGGDPAIDPATPSGLRVVQGIKLGTMNKEHRLVLTSHFDTVFTTRQGAYDDGSGVAAALQICTLLAKVPMNKTLECLFFNNEENGLLASKAYTDWYRAEKPAFTWDHAFGYDMTGLNWPGYDAWKLYALIGRPKELPESFTDDHHRFLETVAFDFLGRSLNTSEDGFEVLDVYDRNSDEKNFQASGIPVVRFAGGRKAGDYPQYHKPDDTVDFVYDFACGMCGDLARGKTLFAAGLGAVVVISVYTILAYDQYDSRALAI